MPLAVTASCSKFTIDFTIDGALQCQQDAAHIFGLLCGCRIHGGMKEILKPLVSKDDPIGQIFVLHGAAKNTVKSRIGFEDHTSTIKHTHCIVSRGQKRDVVLLSLEP